MSGTIESLDGKVVTPEELAEAVRNELIGRTVSDVKITDEGHVLVTFDTGQELEFAPGDDTYGLRFSGMDVN